jgi:nucleoside-diphosphate-sugar epimerase
LETLYLPAEDTLSNETFLITGAFGCIGSWILRQLVDEDVAVVAADLTTEPVRPGLLLSPAELAQVTFAQNDITDLAALRGLIEQHQISHIIHLAGLQVPFCRANPALGAQVNVVGTVNVFEAARQSQGQVRGLSYASSVAALGPDDFYPDRPVRDDAPLYPTTLYGVYKQANENTARLYWQDWQIGSVGLRPYTVYGVGRDQGLTSGPTKAVLATAAGRPYQIKFDGPTALQYAPDVARMFTETARAGHQGAAVCNLRNDVVTVTDFVSLLQAEVPAAQISLTPNQPLPFPADLDDSGLRRILGTVPHTPLSSAIREMMGQFQGLLAKGQVDLRQLEM